MQHRGEKAPAVEPEAPLPEREMALAQWLPLMEEKLRAGGRVRFSPMGISMLPMLRQGRDSIVLEPLPPVIRKYDLPLYRRAGGKFILHRIIGREAGGTYLCMGDNQFTPEPGVTRESMVGLVTGFYRGSRYHSVREPGYRLYCRLWVGSRPLRHLWRRAAGWLRRHLK